MRRALRGNSSSVRLEPAVIDPFSKMVLEQ
jgi:hypothetical protein